jgi:hypothetical protein
MMSIASFIVIALYFWIFVFLVNLKNTDCVCALNWKHDYIMGFIGFVLLFNLYLLLIDTPKKNFIGVNLMFGFVITVAAILNIVLMIQYTMDIQKQKCECADKFTLNIMQFLAFFQIFTIVFVIIFAIIMSKRT